MALAVAEALSPNKPNLDMTLAVTEALSLNKPNLNMALAVTEALSPNKPNLDMTLAVAEALSPNKPNLGMTLTVTEALSLNKPNLNMALAVAEALRLNKPNQTSIWPWLLLWQWAPTNQTKPKLNMTLFFAETMLKTMKLHDTDMGLCLHVKGPSQKYLEANEVKYLSLLPWPPPPSQKWNSVLRLASFYDGKHKPCKM